MGLAIIACGSDAPTQSESEPKIAAIDIRPNVGGAPLGAKFQLSVVGLDSTNREVARKLSVTWSSSNPAAISVDQTGLVTMKSDGGVIRASVIEGAVVLKDSVVVSAIVGAGPARSPGER
jgi:hypothetical protein